MKSIEIKCTNCGGNINLVSRFSKTVVCRYCNTVYLLENNNLKNNGVIVPFEPLSIFKVGTTGTINKKSFMVLGRIRLSDDEDIWDEWLINYDEKLHWLEESSDSIILFSSTPLTQKVDLFDQINVGQVIHINGSEIFIVEKGNAKVIGIEGEFSGKFKINDDYKFIQGNNGEQIFIIEYYQNEIKVFTGIQIAVENITINQ